MSRLIHTVVAAVMPCLVCMTSLVAQTPSVVGPSVVGPSVVGPSRVGAASCSSTACHGGQIASAPIWNRSLAIFQSRDPHALAGILLRNDQSKQIVTRLNRAAADSADVFDNVLRTRCLSCHTTVDPSDCQPIGEISDALLGQGVSCESCHGPASVWSSLHVRDSWTGKKRFDETGFRDNESILGRDQGCVRCHVGSRTADGLIRDVNHDLIAAGHPPLRFDLLSFNKNLSAHWNTESLTEKSFWASSVRLREVGHALGLAAAAQLATQRAAAHLTAPTDVPWPELADYDCFACHQSLTTRSYHLPAEDVNRSPLHISDGLPVWNAWYSSLLLDLRDRKEWLDSLSPTQTGAEQMAERGPGIVLHFLEQARRSEKRTPSAMTLMSTVIDQLQKEPPTDWHAAAVQYLRIEAMLQDLAGMNQMPDLAERASQRLPELRAELLFHQATKDNTKTSDDSENNDDAEKTARGRLLSPQRFRPVRFQKAALALLKKDFNVAAPSNSPSSDAKPFAP